MLVGGLLAVICGIRGWIEFGNGINAVTRSG